MNPFSRALCLGALAGLLVSLGYVALIAIHALAGHSGYSIHLGGSAVIINGVPRVELPGFVIYVSFFGMLLWGILLAGVVARSHRPAWWKAAPLMWLSLGTSLAVAYVAADRLGEYSMYLVPAIGYAVFGALFGWTIRSVGAAISLAVLCPATYVLALLVETLLPAGQIVASLTTYSPYHMSFLHAQEALHQTVLWVLHGVAMGGVTWGVDSVIHDR